ncbi:TetR/AcrR family transcriptional regulator [Kitasatospora sp. NPDC048239]|uniref:TetR/AcrR family transcriptional regulator n=1 Tax=Kitasatospora sp. NPDC048239 TaxID=3364046 RepID=UPI00371D33E7
MSAKQQRGEATVERLLTAALQVYAESGRPGFTVSAVGKASGVSLGSLYHHFGSFDGLAAALYTRCLEQLFDEMITSVRRTRTARTAVRALVQAYLRFTREQHDAALFLHASTNSGYLATHTEEIRDARAAKLGSLAALLRPRIESGEIAPVPEPMLEVLLLGPVAETARRWLSGGYDIDLAEASRVLPERIWRALRPDGDHGGPPR